MARTLFPRIGLMGAALIVSVASFAMPMPVNQNNCALTDLTTSVSCIGVYNPGNDSGAANIFDELDFIAMYGSGWTELDKLNAPATGPAANTGLTLTGQGGTSGTWMVLADAWDGLATGQILGVLKAGDRAAAYELDLTALSGDWDVSGDHWKDPANGQLSGLSHFTFHIRGEREVSEPETLGLLGMAILGLVAMRRRRRRVTN